MSNRKLILDLGNTRSKFAVFEDTELIECIVVSDQELEERILPFSNNHVIISSVRNDDFTKKIISKFTAPFVLSYQTALPIKIKYLTPETLGNDRLANAVGAWSLYPNQNNLIIDAGTCLKFDFVNAENEYLGGSISPGLAMRFKSLHTFTDNLPLIEDVDSNGIIGTSSKSSIQVGVIEGMICEIEGMIMRYSAIYKNINIILTGGDSETIVNLVSLQKNGIFADKFITLKGLNAILAYNEKK